MATAELKSVKNLFGEKFFIPTYQRGYRWEKIQIKELIDDLYSYAQTKPDDNQYYCLQPIVVKKNENTFWEVVDGQQRLTALWVINLAVMSINGMTADNKNSYSLLYENKELFQTVMDSLLKLSQDGASLKDYFQLIDFNKNSDNKCIDEIFLKTTLEEVFSYQCKNATTDNERIATLRKVYALANSIGDIIEQDKVNIIWYVLDNENEDAIETFLNLNANKIELTNAELLKAKLFCEADKTTEDKLFTRKEVALKWEEIEKNLHDDDFWCFISDKEYIHKKYKNSTRIDYLFEIILNNIEDVGRHSIFHAACLYMKEFGVKKLWLDVLAVLETLKDWYSDYYFYHTIGLIVHFLGINEIKALYNQYKEISKSEFRSVVLEQISSIFSENVKYKIFESKTEKDISSAVQNLSYSDTNKVKNLLLLYNIAILVNSENPYERFPFSKYKNDVWNIEHIIPQTPKSEEEISKEELLEWIEANMPTKAIQNTKIPIENMSLEQLSEFIDKNMQVDIDSLGNLVLLDEHTNKKYKNNSFADKRDEIIKVIKNESKSTEFSRGLKIILPGTKWVFLKGHLTQNIDKGTLNYWNLEDVDNYTKDIKNRLFTFFKIKAEVK